MITVLFFARVRDELGLAELTVELPDHVHNLSQFTESLIAANPAFKSVLSQPSILVAVNQEMASATTTVEDGDEIAYFPPVTGG